MTPVTATPSTSTPATLRLTRTVKTDPQTAFDAWTQPEQIKQWACPEDHTVAESSVDLVVGGSYLLQMLSPDGATHTATGVYRHVDPPHRLVYTWDWVEEVHQVGETVVTVEFRATEGSTEVVLTHEALPTDEMVEAHREGWEDCLDHYVQRLG